MIENHHRHPLGHPYGPVERTCASCAWSRLRGPGPRVLRCLAAGGKSPPRVNPDERCCVRWEEEPDCIGCNACCGPAYDVVEVGTRDPVRSAHPELVTRVDGRYRLHRDDQGRCAALGSDGHCRIYSARPVCCRQPGHAALR